MARVVTYECDECGCEVVVTETADTELSPLYCCGMELSEVSAGKKAAKPKKKTSGKAVKKPVKKAPKTVAKKQVTKKKKPAPKKRASRK
jgi:hypothetical protein